MNALIPSISRRGFTLIELVTVMGIIVFLFSMITFPYSYYMDRALVERTLDTLGQEWILAHKEIRGGKLLTSTPSTHAQTLLVFSLGASSVEKYSFSGSIDGLLPLSSDMSPFRSERPLVTFDSSIHVQGMSGSLIVPDTPRLYYVITAPYGEGFFSTGGTWFRDLDVSLSFGFDGGSHDNGRIRSILLRPYLQ